MNETREHILITAFILFLQKSYKEVTMKEIVQASGLSKGAFYHYFKSKEELFNEIVERYYFIMMDVPFDRFDRTSLKQFYHDYVQYLVDSFMNLKKVLDDNTDEDDINFFTLGFDAMRLFQGFKEHVVIHHANELKGWKEMVTIARESGEINSAMSDNQIAKLFSYSNDGIGLRLVMEGRIREVKDEMLNLWDAFYEEIKS